ncbi:MAG: hypothetical protein JXA73_08780 [Acidobacteria bacterium]|nr:hypothetical protein [Acidobacteriota bacterium]
MINPSEIVDNLVDLLRDIPDLVQLMDGDPDRIYAYHDCYPEKTSLEEAKERMKSPGIMVAWTGTYPGSFGGEAWKHQISITLRAQVESSYEPVSSYYAIFRQIVKGMPSSLNGVPLIIATVHPSCNLMDTPTIERQADAAGVDYFEITTAFTEIGDD